MTGHALVLALALLLLAPAASVSPAHYVPAAHDRFAYDETISVSNGLGNYSGYTESTVINGSLGVTSVLPNGTDQAYYYNVDHYQNSEGQSESWTSSGVFVFSPQTFLYVNGTDNQTGYVKPTVWFYIDNSLPVGATFSLLNSPMQVVSTSFDYDLGTAAGGHVDAVFTEGNGSYERNDAYGVFSAQYNWKSYFDPTTGYIIGYLYTEQDTDGAGDGFTLTDTLTVTATSYSLTPGTGSVSVPGTGSQPSNVLLYALVGAVVAVVILVVVVIAVLASRRRRRLPRHSPTGWVPMAPSPTGPPPPPVNLTATGQPPVQQIIIKETVKVTCRYCGSLIDATAETCPFCGATRT
ncbi:MAG TPA: zinc ribbon domain-containing protein [Thermoplasmata archaeon]|nr:zinc ribbon domain-containing protein [Thermoplasmata archaeon]